MELPERITAAFLRQRNACSSQVVLFEQTFPDGATLSLENIHKALAVKLSVAWLAEKVCDREVQAAYHDELRVAWDVYEEASAPAWEVYKESRTAPGFDDPAWKKFVADTVAERSVFDTAKAVALARALGCPVEEPSCWFREKCLRC